MMYISWINLSLNTEFFNEWHCGQNDPLMIWYPTLQLPKNADKSALASEPMTIILFNDTFEEKMLHLRHLIALLHQLHMCCSHTVWACRNEVQGFYTTTCRIPKLAAQPDVVNYILQIQPAMWSCFVTIWQPFKVYNKPYVSQNKQEIQKQNTPEDMTLPCRAWQFYVVSPTTASDNSAL